MRKSLKFAFAKKPRKQIKIVSLSKSVRPRSTVLAFQHFQRVWSVECGVWSVECRVKSVEYRV